MEEIIQNSKITGIENINYVIRGIKRKRRIRLINCILCGERNINRGHELCSKCYYETITRHEYKEDREYRRSYYDKNKERIKENTKFQRKKAMKLLGNRCFICGGTKGIVFHKKDGKRHNTNCYNAILRGSKDYVVLCRPYCHTGVHFCMKHLKIGWEYIRENLNYSRSTLENTR